MYRQRSQTKIKDMIVIAENNTFKAVETKENVTIYRKALDINAIAPDGSRAWEDSDLTNPTFAEFFVQKVWRILPLENADDAQYLIDEEVASVQF